jgi:hypothetical protein
MHQRNAGLQARRAERFSAEIALPCSIAHKQPDLDDLERLVRSSRGLRGAAIDSSADNIVNGFDEFTKALQHHRAKYRRRCIHRIHILGHGGEIWSGATGAVIGSSILIGVSDELRSTDFDDAGNLVPGAQKTKDFLDALKAALCPGGRIVFSACNQGVGSLLEDISKYIDNGTTVEGHSGLGIPWLPGDMSFVDGQRQ